jgi:uncharacterized protein YfaS (alpha-2-macroglobulin family)
LGKYARLLQKEASRYEAEVRVDGKSVATATHEKPLTLTPPAGSKVEVTVRGQGRAYCHWWAEGLPLREDVHEEDSDLRVRRRLLDRHGNAIERIRLGDVVVVELSLANAEPVDNVVVSDLLPAGLEIENPRLATRDGAVASKASMPAFEPSHVERRDDRLLVFADFGNAGTRTYQYAARAVACGRFRLPPVSAHAMYRPDVRSTHGAGHVEVFRE